MKQKSIIKSLFLLPVLVLLTGCATIFLGPRQEVNVNSDPPGAQVVLNGQETSYTTPCRMEVKRKVKESSFNQKNENVYVFKKEGYEDATFRTKSSVHWLTILDYLYYIVPGLIDTWTGSNRVFNDFVYASLSESQSEEPDAENRELKEVPVISEAKIPEVEDNSQTTEIASDIDQGIPLLPARNENSFALIIGNEDYQSYQKTLSAETNVDYAKRDAVVFKEYLTKTLGLPELNIILLTDATFGQMMQGIHKMNLIIKNTNGNAQVIVYYAGHGLPDETTNEPVLMPVDVSGMNIQNGIKLTDMVNSLSEYPSKRITLFIDACFSGGARNQSLVSARGVKVKPKVPKYSGNVVIFSSSSGSQSSLPYHEQGHGMFTYYLLKTIKETNGNISYESLFSKLNETISLKSLLINNKEQNPGILVGYGAENYWKDWNLSE